MAGDAEKSIAQPDAGTGAEPAGPAQGTESKGWPVPAASFPAALVTGLKTALEARRLTFGLYLFNLAWALVWTLPLYILLSGLIQGRPAGHDLALALDLEILIELLLANPGLGGYGLALLLYCVAGYLIFSIFLLGGVVGTLGRSDRAGLSGFMGAGARAFGRLLGMGLLFAVFYGLCLFVLWAGIGLAAVLTEEMSSSWAIIWHLAAALPGLAALLMVDAAYDYARIHLVVFQGRASFWRGLGFGWKVLFRRWASPVWLHLAFSLMSWLFVGAMILLPHDYDAGSGLRFGLGFLTWQALVFMRVWMRVAGLAGQKALLPVLPDEQVDGASRPR